MIKIAVAGALVVSSLCCSAQADLKEQLKPLAFLLGSCWSGKFQNGAVDTHCFEPMLGGHFIRDRHEVIGGKSVYAGKRFTPGMQSAM